MSLESFHLKCTHVIFSTLDSVICDRKSAYMACILIPVQYPRFQSLYSCSWPLLFSLLCSWPLNTSGTLDGESALAHGLHTHTCAALTLTLTLSKCEAPDALKVCTPVISTAQPMLLLPPCRVCAGCWGCPQSCKEEPRPVGGLERSDSANSKWVPVSFCCCAPVHLTFYFLNTHNHITVDT